MATVWMRHPTLPPTQLIKVPESAVPHQQAAGWEVTDAPPPKPKVRYLPGGRAPASAPEVNAAAGPEMKAAAKPADTPAAPAVPEPLPDAPAPEPAKKAARKRPAQTAEPAPASEES